MAELVMQYTINGYNPGLLLHNSRLSDPEDDITKKIKELEGKGNKKNDAVQAELSWLYWSGGLYYTDGVGVVIPSQNIEAMLANGACKVMPVKLSPRKLFQSSVFCTEIEFPLEYKGPKDLAKLFANKQFVHRCMMQMRAAGGGRVPRIRPYFKSWTLSFSVMIVDDGPNPDVVTRALEAAGRCVGIGDSRPKFGRFSVVEAKKK